MKVDNTDTPVEVIVPEVVAAPAVLPEQTVVKPVTEAVIETVYTEDTTAETTVALSVVVTEVVLETAPVELLLPAEIQPAKVLNVSVALPEKIEEAVELFIPEQMTIAIPMDEDEIVELEDMRLVLVLADGSMIEIPFEIVEGKLVFTTTQMGVFAFVPAEELEKAE